MTLKQGLSIGEPKGRAEYMSSAAHYVEIDMEEQIYVADE